jgi:hypothetical protein
MALTQSRSQPGPSRGAQWRQAPLNGIGLAGGIQALMAGRVSARGPARPAWGYR